MDTTHEAPHYAFFSIPPTTYSRLVPIIPRVFQCQMPSTWSHLMPSDAVTKHQPTKNNLFIPQFFVLCYLSKWASLYSTRF